LRLVLLLFHEEEEDRREGEPTTAGKEHWVDQLAADDESANAAASD
jgi:hypothetical protein